MRMAVNLPEKQHAALAAPARKHDVPPSWLKRKAIIALITQHRTESPRLALNLPLQSKAKGQ